MKSCIYNQQDSAMSLRKISSRIAISILFFQFLAFFLPLLTYIFISLASSIELSQKTNSFLTFFASPGGQQLYSLIVTVAAEVLTIYLLAKSLRFNILTLFKKPTECPKYVVRGFTWTLAMNVIISILTQIIIFFTSKYLGVAPVSPDMSIKNFDDPLYLICFIVTAIITAPILEEILFRGLILRSLQNFGNVFAIVVSSILFAIFHGNFEQAIPAFFIGFILGMDAIRTNSIIASIIIHALNNGFLVLSQILSNYIDPNIFTLFYSLFLIIVLVIGFILYKTDKSSIKIVDNNISGLSKNSRIIEFIKSPFMFVLLCIIFLQLIFTIDLV